MLNPARRRRLRLAALPLLLATGLLTTACGTGTTPDQADTISADTFVSTYVELRLAVLNSEKPTTMTDSLRAAILARHGVSERDLLDFAKAHGPDPAFMKSVWDSVEERINATRPDAGVSKPGPPRDSTPRPDR